jgi:hypothetical protein
MSIIYIEAKTKEIDMIDAKVETSKITTEGIEVEWSDGCSFLFKMKNFKLDILFLVKIPFRCFDNTLTKIEFNRREIVSRTSAKLTLEGCGV